MTSERTNLQIDRVEKGDAITITRHGRPLAVLANADGLPLRIGHEMPSVLELNERAAGHTLTPYDAVYFELAPPLQPGLAAK